MDYNIFRVKEPLENFPNISKHLKVAKSKNFGRFIYATRDFEAGEILFIEEPFFYSIDRNDVPNKRCAFCLSICTNSSSLTCYSCKSEHYCSPQCLSESLHENECSLVRKADKNDGFFLLMTRVLMKSINICGNLAKFQTFIENRDRKMTFLDAPSEDNLVKLCCCFNLECGNFPQDVKFSKLFVESEKMKCLKIKDEKEKFFLVKIILKILGILNRNSFCFEFFDGNSCGAIFSFASLINHSCSPNVEKISLGGKKMAFASIRPIRKSEQIFICYRRHFYEKNSKIRRQELLDQFDFICQCEACIDPRKFNFTFIAESQLLNNYADIHLLLELFRKNCNFICENNAHYPNVKLIALISKNVKILQHLADNYEKFKIMK